jgi:transcription initiation factor IIE alpha subunit
VASIAPKKHPGKTRSEIARIHRLAHGEKMLLKLIDAIETGPTATNPQLAAALDISVTQVKTYLRRLTKRGCIKCATSFVKGLNHPHSVRTISLTLSLGSDK